jgi:hypothetical protein
MEYAAKGLRRFLASFCKIFVFSSAKALIPARQFAKLEGMT